MKNMGSNDSVAMIILHKTETRKTFTQKKLLKLLRF